MDLFKIYLSRSAGSFCGFNQTSESYRPEDGADLKIQLDEAERIRKSIFQSINYFEISLLDDNCPIRYDDGRNPWQIIDELLFYYASNAIVFTPNYLIILVILKLIFFK
jgi:hypothetical protein